MTNDLRNPLAEFLRKEEQRCKYKIQTFDDRSIIGRCAQSRLHLIEKIRDILSRRDEDV